MSSTLIIPKDIVRHKAYYDKQNIKTQSIYAFKCEYNLHQIKVYNNRPAEGFKLDNPNKVVLTIDLPTYAPEYIKCLGIADQYCKPIKFNGVISTMDNCIHVLHHEDDDPSIIMAMRVAEYINTL